MYENMGVYPNEDESSSLESTPTPTVASEREPIEFAKILSGMEI